MYSFDSDEHLSYIPASGSVQVMRTLRLSKRTTDYDGRVSRRDDTNEHARCAFARPFEHATRDADEGMEIDTMTRMADQEA